jgi:IS30 family transposase
LFLVGYLYNFYYYIFRERRRKVASLLAQSLTEAEIAQELGVNQSIISRDKLLKETITTI